MVLVILNCMNPDKIPNRPGNIFMRVIVPSMQEFFLGHTRESTFCVSFGGGFVPEPKTSFPEVWRAAVPDEVEPVPLVARGIKEETGTAACCGGFPSKRLPTPVNGLNFGSSSTGSSWAERQYGKFNVGIKERKRKIKGESLKTR